MPFGSVGSALFGDEPSAEIGSESTLSGYQEGIQAMLYDIFTGKQKRPLETAIASPAEGRFLPYEDKIVGDLSSLEKMSLAGLEQIVANMAAGVGAPATMTSPTAAPGGKAGAEGFASMTPQTMQAGMQTAAPTAGGANEVVQASQRAFLDLLTQGPQDFENYFQSAVYDPLTEQFQEEILPGVSARNAAKFFGSERMTQDREVTEDLSEALAGSRGQLAFEARENQLNRVLQALGLSEDVAGLGMGVLERGLRAGEVPREVETSQRLSAYEEFMRGQDRDMDLLKLMAGISTSPTREVVGVSKGGSQGLLGQALGAASVNMTIP